LLRSSEVLQQAFKRLKRWSTENVSQQIRYAGLSIGYEWNFNYCHMLQVQNMWGSDVLVRDLVSFVVGHSGRVAGVGRASFACKVHSERIA